MAKTEYIDILPEQGAKFYKALQHGDRFIHSHLRQKITNFSRKRKKGMTQKSLLPQIAALWAGLSSAQKTAWTTAGAECSLNGWRLFVQDCCARIYNDIAGVATPAVLHQSWVGNLKIEAPAEEIKITQVHPVSYWVLKKVTGKKAMYQPVVVTEFFAFPVTIFLNYKSELTEVTAGSFAKFYARFWSSYQGVDRFTDLEIPLDYFSDWKNATATLSSVIGHVIGYDLFFHLFGVQGDVYFDNVKVTHSAQNWVRDPFCKDILQGFTRAFYQIPAHWAAITLPTGAQYDSIYKDF